MNLNQLGTNTWLAFGPPLRFLQKWRLLRLVSGFSFWPLHSLIRAAPVPRKHNSLQAFSHFSTEWPFGLGPDRTHLRLRTQACHLPAERLQNYPQVHVPQAVKPYSSMTSVTLLGWFAGVICARDVQRWPIHAESEFGFVSGRTNCHAQHAGSRFRCG